MTGHELYAYNDFLISLIWLLYKCTRISVHLYMIILVNLD